MARITCGPKIQCTQCQEIIQSTHIHDMRWCKCGRVATDGGSDYTKIIGTEYIWVS